MATFGTTPAPSTPVRPRPTGTAARPPGAVPRPRGSAGSPTVSETSATATNLVVGADGSVIVPVVGDVDLDTVHLLLTRLVEAIDRGDPVCCDLSQVTFFGAAGANTLLEAHRHATACGRRFSLRGARGLTRRVITSTGLDRVLAIED